MDKNELDQDFDDLLEMLEEPGTQEENENEGKTEQETKPETEIENEQVVTATETEIETGEEEETLETLRERNRLLQEQLGLAYTQQIKTENNEVVEPVADALKEETLFGEWSFEKIVENETDFKKFLGEFATKVKNATEESLLRKLPGTVAKLTKEQMDTRQTVNSFYDEHEQLATVKPFVAQVVSTVASEHADWPLDKVLEESATRAYKALGLKKQATEPVKTGGKKPAFAGPASGKRGVDPNAGKSKLEKELEELMELE